MRVRVSYIEEVTDNDRRAINDYYGDPGLASRNRVKDWFAIHGYGNGRIILDDHIYSMQQKEEDDA